MHDIWNPWHGCRKCSEGCDHCYMYTLDRLRGQDGAAIFRTGSFDYPLRRTRGGGWQVRSGEQLRVCMTSDFFLAEADRWRPEAWDIIHRRPDVMFFLVTKRPQRIPECLPPDWGGGWPNVFLNVTCENQRRADERIPLLLQLPFAHKGLFCTPFLGPVSIARWLSAPGAPGGIEQVICGGENYDGCRPCRFEWVQALAAECRAADVTFCFIETGTHFIRDGRHYVIPKKQVQSQAAFRCGLNRAGRPLSYALTDTWGLPLSAAERYVPRWRPCCRTCGSQLICNGCSDCGKCGPGQAKPDPTLSYLGAPVGP